MPTSKGGKKSRCTSRKKPKREENILKKKKNKRKMRCQIIKDRGNFCEISPMTLDASSVILDSRIIDTSRAYATPSEVNMIAATYSQVVKRTSKRSGSTLDRVQK